jgi:hypothetical protein
MLEVQVQIHMSTIFSLHSKRSFGFAVQLYQLPLFDMQSNLRKFSFSELWGKIHRWHMVNVDYTRFLLCTRHAEVMTRFIL